MITNYITYLNNKKKSENTIKTYSRHIESMLEFVGKPENEITSLDLLGWQNSISNLSSATINLETAAIKNYFEFLNNYGVISSNPASVLETPKRENKEKEYMSADMIKEMVAHAGSYRNRAIVLTYASTGMRVSELTNVTLAQYQEMKKENNNYILITGKGNKQRRVYFNPQVMDAIDRYIMMRPKIDNCGALFLSREGNKIDSKNLGESIKMIARKAGIKNWEHISNHSLRAACASIMSENGTPVAVIRDTLGHSSISTTSRYIKTNTEQISAANMNMVF